MAAAVAPTTLIVPPYSPSNSQHRPPTTLPPVNNKTSQPLLPR